MKIFRCAVIEIFKSMEEEPGIFFLGQSPDVKQELPRFGNLERGPGRCGVIWGGTESGRVHPEIDRPNVIHAPPAQDRPQTLGRDQRSRELAVKVPNIAAREVHHGFAGGVSKKLGRAPDVSLWKMRMVKTYHRNS